MTSREKAYDLVQEFILMGFTHEHIVDYLINDYLPSDTALAGMQALIDEYTPDEEEEEDEVDFDLIRSHVKTARKEDSPEDTPKTELSKLPENIKAMLSLLPIVTIDKEEEDLFSLFDEYFEENQWWLLSWKGRTFFVDTQGYSYARYCGELI